jgi:hypothetical protein
MDGGSVHSDGAEARRTHTMIPLLLCFICFRVGWNDGGAVSHRMAWHGIEDRWLVRAYLFSIPSFPQLSASELACLLAWHNLVQLSLF